MFVCMHARIWVCNAITCVYVCVYIYIYIYIYLYMYVCMYVCTVVSLFKTSCLMKKRLLGLDLNKTCKQLTHFPPCDFDSVWCAVLLVARHEVCRKKIWASWYLQNPFSTIKSLIKACKYADFHTRSAQTRAHCAQITLTELNTHCMCLVHACP